MTAMLAPLVSDMGRLQVNFYLVLLAGLFLVGALVMTGVGVPSLVRLAREPGSMALAAIVGGAMVLAVVFVIGLGVWFVLGLFGNAH